MTVDGRRNNGKYPRGLTVEQRFWNKVDGGDFTDCWLWTAAVKPTGYGCFTPTSYKTVNAHRWAYTQMVGDIPEGLQLDHLCRVRHCVNPYHLDPVTPLVNTRRGRGGASKTHCPKGHPYDDENTYRNAGRRFCRTCQIQWRLDNPDYWRDWRRDRSAA